MRKLAEQATESSQQARKSARVQMIGRIGPYLWPKGEPEIRLRVIAAVVLIVGAKVLTTMVPVALKHTVDALSSKSGSLVVAPVALILLYGLTRVTARIAEELQELVFARVVQRVVRLIALEVFRHLHGLSLRFHLDRQTGGLSRSIERGTAGIESLFDVTLFSLFPTVIELTLVTGLLWHFYDWVYASVTLGTVLVYVAFTVAITQWRNKVRREMNTRDTQANARAIDSLLNFETVKYFANEEHEARRYDVAKQGYMRAAIRSQVTLSILNMGQQAIMSTGLVAMLLMAGNGVAAGHMTVGDFVLVNAYLLQLYQPLNYLGMIYRVVRQSLTDVEQLHALLDHAPDVTDRPGAPAIALSGGAVRFEDVSFGYDARRSILDSVSFEIPPNRTVAIVGATGSGKSTIARLLFRFYDVDRGRITIDGQDLRDVTQDSLRRAIGVVPQDTVLFNDTIYYNILYGRPDATRAEVEEATRLAQLDAFIARLPDGYETRVGERGLKLSGGEKQRVAIARVLVKRPRVLIFDEATSALDTHTEREIQASLKAVAAERTTLVIAHRLSTIIDADEILVLDHGRVVERGHHMDLLAADGLYAALWNRQQERTEQTLRAVAE